MKPTEMKRGEMTPAEMVAQRPNPGELAAVARRMERTGGCRRPIRLVGRSRDGGYETKDEPDGVLLVACGTRHATRCPPCAYIYQGDARHVIRSGMEGGKGVPESVAEHPMAFFTLTAPSFGLVHAAKKGHCHVGPPGNCAHGRSRHCLAVHGDEDKIVGAPLCSDCYDWERAVLYNFRAGDLWRRVTIYTFRHLAYCLGVTEKALRKEVRLSFAKVTEFQRRGAVHVHGVLRADGIGDEMVPPPPEITAALLCEAIVRATYAAAVTDVLDGEIVRLAFGTQVRADPLEHGETRRIAAYISKYCSKQADTGGVLDHRLRQGELENLDLPEHLLRLVRTAFELGEVAGHESCRRWAHCLAWRGHLLSKSRRWSTTFCRLRMARRLWRQAEAGEAMSAGTTTWTFDGVGLQFEIDRLFALGVETRRAEDRLVSPRHEVPSDVE